MMIFIRKIFLVIMAVLPGIICDAESREIKLGALLPLSGNLSSYGEAIKQGLDSAVSGLAKQGIPVKIYYEDVPLPNAQALTAVTRLVGRHRVSGIVANFWNPVVPMILPVIRKYKVPVFHTAIADDHILGSGPLVFSVMGRVKDEARRLAEYTVSELKSKKAAVFAVQTNWGESYSRHFIDNSKKLGVEVVIDESLPVNEFDFRAFLAKVNKSQPDVIFLALFGPQLGILIKQLRESGIQAKVLSTYESEDASVREAIGNNIDGIYYSSIGSDEFRADDRSSNLLTICAYDSVWGIVDLLTGKNLRFTKGIFLSSLFQEDGGVIRKFEVKSFTKKHG